MSRVYNFCAGPAALPEAVLTRAQEELLEWQGQGASVMELSHRSKAFIDVMEQAESRLRRLLGVPHDYAVLFQQGGASQQFAAVPLNLSSSTDSADYLVTGQWSKKALAEGTRFLNAHCVADGSADNFMSIPTRDGWSIGGGRYFHYCPNETIGGLEFATVPEVDSPLVADMSSTLLSRPIDVTQFGVIYAGAQKNIGPAGLALVVVRKELLGQARSSCPAMLNWETAATNGSMYNTPPTFAVYLTGLVFEWLESMGGLDAMGAINSRKAARLYNHIDSSEFYSNPVSEVSRSWMNVPFTLADSALDKVFLDEAEQVGLTNLKGHRSVGGMRASIYNAVPETAVEALCNFMSEFEQRYG
ncbi:MAG: 3-phosphoserine/phosphohydroxythreonine transaminase [Luminiphilus sp.]|nr:3-phosphoserine/phosphohydroxythreonine transaminase [Luminiphilus sp.]MDG1459989.1 3-phosphoserine/phosphohydroxythreonine transaminase [Luminiphilus sp.]